MSPDLIAGMIAFLFTVMVLSYLIGDNPLFRFSMYVFVGVSAGYVAVVAWWQVLWPNVVVPVMSGTSTQKAQLAVPILLSGLLLMKAWPPLTRLGMPAMGLLVGTGAAVAIGGAVNGTLLPQIAATINAFGAQKVTAFEAFVDGVFILVGVITSLVYFHFSAHATADGTLRRYTAIEIIAFVGSIFVAVTLGVLFAGIYSAALTAMIQRLYFLGTFFGIR